MSRFSNLEFESDGDGELRRNNGNDGLPRDEAYYLRNAQTAFEEGDFERALRAFNQVIEYNPKNPVPWTGQVRVLIELGEYREAKVWADKALEQFPHEPDLLAAKAVALARTGDLKAALAFSDASFEERGNTAYMWIARADVLLARKETRAEYCFEKAASAEPLNWFIRWLIARVQFFYGRFVIALKVTQEALALDAARAVLWLQLGLCQRQLGLIEAATESVGRAAQLDPQNGVASAALVSIPETDFLARSWARLRGFFSQ
jgi:tetratricopeptide (TPR) repeat protein